MRKSLLLLSIFLLAAMLAFSRAGYCAPPPGHHPGPRHPAPPPGHHHPGPRHPAPPPGHHHPGPRHPAPPVPPPVVVYPAPVIPPYPPRTIIHYYPAGVSISYGYW